MFIKYVYLFVKNVSLYKFSTIIRLSGQLLPKVV